VSILTRSLICLRLPRCCSARRPLLALTLAPLPRWSRQARRPSTLPPNAGRHPRRTGIQLSTIRNSSRIPASSPLAVVTVWRFQTFPNAVPERVRRVAKGRTDAKERSVIRNVESQSTQSTGRAEPGVAWRGPSSSVGPSPPLPASQCRPQTTMTLITSKSCSFL